MSISNAVHYLRQEIAASGVNADEVMIGVDPAAVETVFRTLCHENGVDWEGCSLDLAGIWIVPVVIRGFTNGSDQDYGTAPTPGRQSPA